MCAFLPWSSEHGWEDVKINETNEVAQLLSMDIVQAFRVSYQISALFNGCEVPEVLAGNANFRMQRNTMAGMQFPRNVQKA